MTTASLIVKWCYIALLIIGSMITVSKVGKPRHPTTSDEAAAHVFVTAVFVTMIVIFWGTQ